MVTENGATYYYVNGVKQTNHFVSQNGNMYYFGADGKEYKDQFYSNWGNMYYFGSDGARYTNQFYSNWGNMYYFGEGGVRYTNQFYSNWGNMYYFGSDGARYTNQFYSNWGKRYYFGSDGARYTNREYDNWGNKYYFGSDGALATNTDVTLNGTVYTADSQGILTVKNDINAKVNKALGEIGVPYVWGGNSPSVGFDCSGLVQWAYGLSSSYRTTYQQQTLGTHVYSNVSSSPKGALLFFGSDSAPYHVAISLGDGSYVHAPTVGENVKIGYQKYFTPSYYIVLS
ncbi:NlpC/P60 family protein [Limosilactobacillus fermentum]|uniref:NlpC/P60 family protein n=1 Tax=Limosilactobacillus fermentum TaxID=1613 RepID=UPI0021A4EE1E|nr:NlpC/P60 family protein [Limosilactobacillus fermentum]MDU4239192.1 NlpC/P60 family protein [Limosilactobacillus fermentum]